MVFEMYKLKIMYTIYTLCISKNCFAATVQLSEFAL